MRGKADVVQQAVSCIGITPAYAGKSLCFGDIGFQVLDHPRLCGEKPPDTFGQLTQLGSPPPMRGKVPQFYFSQTVYRITPAYAGKSTWKCMPFAT